MNPLHGGSYHETAFRLGCSVEDLMDFSANLNPLGPPPGLLEHLRAHIRRICMLPDTSPQRTGEALARIFSLDPEHVLAGNGTSFFIYSLPLVLATKRALILAPTYADYQRACLQAGAEVDFFMVSPGSSFPCRAASFAETSRAYDTVFICNPNNPTGMIFSRDFIHDLCREASETVFVVDETYMDFLGDAERQSVGDLYLENLIVMISLSKIFTLPGLRMGLMVGSPSRIREMKARGIPWAVNAMAQESALYLGENRKETLFFMEKTRDWLQGQRKEMERGLKDIPGFCLYPGSGIFQLAELSGRVDPETLCRILEKEKIILRDCGNIPGMPDGFIRFSFRSEAENRILAERLRIILAS